MINGMQKKLVQFVYPITFAALALDILLYDSELSQLIRRLCIEIALE